MQQIRSGVVFGDSSSVRPASELGRSGLQGKVLVQRPFWRPPLPGKQSTSTFAVRTQTGVRQRFGGTFFNVGTQLNHNAAAQTQTPPTRWDQILSWERVGAASLHGGG